MSFDPTMASARQVRRFVTAPLVAWGLEELSDDAMLCATELAANAILHTRRRFTITVRPTAVGVRIDALDNSPAQLPVPVPREGTAVDLTTSGTTGRGLQIVAAVADRWGFATTDDAKTVWAELTGERPPVPRLPSVMLGHHPAPTTNAVTLVFLGVPVRLTVASGIQVEDVVRQLQLNEAADKEAEGPDLTEFFELLDLSAPVRLAGHHDALRAAAATKTRFDLRLRTTIDTLVALSQFAGILAGITNRWPELGAPVSREVAALRLWFDGEVSSQLSGHPPVWCPLEARMAAAD